MAKLFVFVAFLAIFALKISESAADVINCYQCTENVLEECELSKSSTAKCSKVSSVCLLQRRKDANPGSTLAIRKCVIPPTECPSGYDCTQCDEDFCNDVVKPKIQCYQCPLNIKEGCRVEEAMANSVKCLGDSDACLLRYPENGVNENGIRRCTHKDFKCPKKENCFFCNGNNCNSGMSLSFSISAVILAVLSKFL